MPFTLIKNGCQYTVTLNRVPYKTVKDYVNMQKKYLNFLSDSESKKNILTKNQKNESLAILNNFKKHSSHATLNVKTLDLKTGESYEYNYVITSKPNAVTILPSLSEAKVGETVKSYEVMEFAKDLYLTNHSIYNRLHSKFELLRYDKDKDRYIEIATDEPYDITKKDLENMFLFVVNKIESKEVKQIDITSKGDFTNDIVSLKMLEMFQAGQLDNKSYPEIKKELNIVNENFIQNEIEFEIKHEIKFNEE